MESGVLRRRRFRILCQNLDGIIINGVGSIFAGNLGITPDRWVVLVRRSFYRFSRLILR